ncbi:RDD family protein [Proteobacteria bacterium 005FR1]|nr:RDD family protein [Proteobacteria bacterium 005FR1]
MSESQAQSPSAQPVPSPQPGGNLFRRLAAMIYDTLLLLGLSFAYGGIFAVWIPNWIADEPTPLGELPFGDLGMFFFQLGWLALIVGFFTYFWHRGGQTLGMRAWRLRIQQPGGGSLTYTQCLLRCALAFLSMAAVGLGYLWCLIDRERQTAHDRLSGTETVTLPKPAKQ